MTKSKPRQQMMQRAHGTDWATCPRHQIPVKLVEESQPERQQEIPPAPRRRTPRNEINWNRWGFR